MAAFASHLHRAAFANAKMLPTGPIEVDRSHPLANGLVGLFLPGIGTIDFSQLGSKLVMPSAGSVVASAYGPAYNSAGGANGALIGASGINAAQQSQNYTLIWFGKISNAAPGADSVLVGVNVGATGLVTSPYTHASIYLTNGTGKITLAEGHNGSFNFNVFNTTLTAGTYAHVAATFSSGAAALYTNGSQFGTWACSTGTQSFSASDTLQIGDSRTSSTGFTVPFAFFFNRVLSAAEIAQHAQEPLAMLRPAQPMLRAANSNNTIYSDNITDSTSAAAAEIAVAIFRNAVTEAGSASDDNSAPLVVPASTSEAGSVSDATQAGLAFSNTLTDTASATDTLAASTTFNVTIGESGSASDTLATSAVLANALTESGSVAESISNALVIGASTTETGTASDANVSNPAFNISVGETGAASDALGIAYAINQSITESGAASDSAVNHQLMAVNFGEFGNAVDSAVVGGLEYAVESLSASDAISVSFVMRNQIAESASAAESVGGGLVINKTVVEAGSVSDTPSTGTSYSAAVSESGAASEQLGAVAILAQLVSETGLAAELTQTQLRAIEALVQSGALGETISLDQLALLLPMPAQFDAAHSVALPRDSRMVSLARDSRQAVLSRDNRTVQLRGTPP